MKSVYLTCFYSMFFTLQLSAQLPNQVLFDEVKTQPKDSGLFGIALNNTNYMRNTEYFNPIEEGRTLFGYQLCPVFYFQPATNIKLSAGAWMRHDFGGNNPFTRVVPVFSLLAQKNNHTLLFGTLQGSLTHGMPEPMMDINSIIEKRIENGFQYLYQSEKIKSDLWINWENFLEPHEFDKERFTAGLNFKWKIANTTAGSFYGSVLGMASHQGGQIDIDTISPFMMQFNPGLALAWEKQNNFNNKVFADIYALSYLETSSSGLYPETNGKGFLYDAGYQYKSTTFMFSYWNGSNYIAPRGTHIYQSVSTVDPLNYQKNRSLLFFRAIHNKALFQSPVMVSARFEPVYDFNNGIFDFSYSLYLVYKGDWKLNKSHTPR